ncbi:hypothetical protein [Promicromonospora iranensis]|uniref:PRC-barrel domain protein n=1 Tax=Promicromonospora iranensis TaxID=1105144 RepID=A0ABU2CJH7_9MICO|nr:hypothetical protein [Promicromonospora iranensis]MDR7381489.1 hypothetical protein [Promicromonospora iranensis]
MRRTRTGPRDVSREPEPRQPGRVLDARLHLLDRQVLDVDGMPVCTLDDLELEAVDGRSAVDERIDGSVPVVITDLLTGPVLGTRVFGGRPPASRWHRLPWAHVVDIGTAVRLSVRSGDLDATWLERWTRDHIIGRIPGGNHDPESSG